MNRDIRIVEGKQEEPAYIGPDEANRRVTNVCARAFDAKTHSDSNICIGTRVDHNEARFGINCNNASFPDTALLDLALGLLTLSKRNFEFAKLNLYFLAEFRIRSNSGAQIVFNDR